MTQPYQQLRVYTYYDFLKSTITPEIYLKKLVLNKEKYATFVGNKNVFGLVSFALEAHAKGLKPILGLSLGDVKIDNQTIPVTVYAKNFIGLKQIFKLSSRLLDGSKTKLNFDDLKKNKNGLIFVIHFNFLISRPAVEQLLTNLHELDDACFYGVSNMNLLLENIKGVIPEKKLLVFFPTKMLKETEKPLLKQIKKIIDADNNASETETEISYFTRHLELESKFAHLFGNEKQFLKLINFDLIIELLKHQKAVIFKTEKDDETKMKFECEKKLKEKFPGNKLYQERFELEFKVIKKKQIVGYFLIVQDYVNFAKKQNIIVGTGRGSAAGSLISYLLGITKIDPIEHKLIFERFLNDQRKSMPDIDLDFQDNRREEVIQYLFDHHPENHVAMVSTFQRIRPRLAIRDLGRVLGVPLDDINKISKNFAEVRGPINASFDSVASKVSDSLILQNYAQKYPQLFEFANQIIGFPRQPGTHAAGIVISLYSFSDLFGNWKNNDFLCLQLDMNELSKFGLIKMDILGLRNLTLISDILDSHNMSEDKNAFLEKIDFHDSGVYSDLADGKTKGLFQLESPGMTALIKKVNPKSIQDVTNVISLFRPGPMKNIGTYLKQKEGTKITYLIPEFESILKETHGIPIYQEQIIQMVNIFSGIDYGSAEVFRKAISKKDKVLIAEFHQVFIANATKRGHSLTLINEVWTLIEKFADYGFNRSHAVSYAYISYSMAYFKHHFFAEFMIALLNAWLGDADRLFFYLSGFKKEENIKIYLPTVTGPIFRFEKHQSGVILPLITIKNIGVKFAEKFDFERKKHGPFSDIYNFFVRFIRSGGTETIYKRLVQSGALQSFFSSPKSLLENWITLKILADTLITESGEIKWNALSKDKYPKLNDRKTDPDVLWIDQKKALGFTLEPRPSLAKFIKKNVTIAIKSQLISIKDLETFKNKTTCMIAVYIVATEEYLTKTGDKMAKVKVSDGVDKLNITVFPAQWKEFELVIDRCVLLELRIGFWNGLKNFYLMTIKA